MKIRTLLAAAVVGIGAVACGGNDFVANPPATSQVPASASASIDGFIAYLKELVATVPATSDRLEPVDTSMVTAPADETSEPQKVD